MESLSHPMLLGAGILPQLGHLTALLADFPQLLGGSVTVYRTALALARSLCHHLGRGKEDTPTGSELEAKPNIPVVVAQPTQISARTSKSILCHLQGSMTVSISGTDPMVFQTPTRLINQLSIHCSKEMLVQPDAMGQFAVPAQNC